MLHHPGQPVGSVWLLDGFAFSKNGITGLVHFHGFQMLLNLFLFNIFYLGLGPNVFFWEQGFGKGPLWTKAYQTFRARALIMPGICSNAICKSDDFFFGVALILLSEQTWKRWTFQAFDSFIHGGVACFPSPLDWDRSIRKLEKVRTKEAWTEWIEVPQLGLATERHWRAE